MQSNLTLMLVWFIFSMNALSYNISRLCNIIWVQNVKPSSHNEVERKSIQTFQQPETFYYITAFIHCIYLQFIQRGTFFYTKKNMFKDLVLRHEWATELIHYVQHCIKCNIALHATLLYAQHCILQLTLHGISILNM